MKTINKAIKISVASLLLGAAIVIPQSCTNSEAKNVGEENTGIPVKAVYAQHEQVSFPVHVSGNITASKESRLSFKTGGIIKHIYVHSGDKVKAGQVLAQLDLNEIQQSVNQAKIGLEKATRDYSRAKALYQDTVATLEQFQNATSALDVAKANLNIAEYNLRHSTIYAPSDGIILGKFFEENEITNTGLPVFYFASSEELWRLVVGVSDKDLVKFNIDDRATIVTDAWPNNPLKCSVSKIANAPGQFTGLYEVELSIEKTNLNLKPGFFAKGEIYPSVTQSLVSMPIDAIQEGSGDNIVFFTVDKTKNIAIKQETKMAVMKGDKVYVNSNDNNNDMLVIVEKQKELKHLDKVNITESNALVSLNSNNKDAKFIE